MADMTVFRNINTIRRLARSTPVSSVGDRLAQIRDLADEAVRSLASGERSGAGAGRDRRERGGRNRAAGGDAEPEEG